MKRTVVSAVAVCLLINSSVPAAQDSVLTDFTLWSRLTMGQVVSSTVERAGYDIPFEGEWLETIDGGLKIIRVLSPSLTGRLNLGVVINAATVTPKGLTYEYGAKKAVPALLDATLEFHHGGLFTDNDIFTAEVGYFPFKYNPESTNLGEYIFRTGTYPGWIMSGFENSIDRPKLAGVHLSYSMGSVVRIRQDFIANTELEVFPYKDINFTYILTPSFGPLFNFGLGVEFARLIAVDPEKTTIGLDSIYKDRYDPKIGYIDTVSNDTIKYTFKGTKLTCRATLDFKHLFNDAAQIFGTEDFKLYGEAALLGVKNYPGWYENRKDRVPVMVGFTLPTFKLLDVLSIEIERYTSPYANGQDYIWKGASPVPYVAGRPSGSSFPDYDRDWDDSLAQTDDDIKWSIYASRKIGKYIRISAQAACDHTPKNRYTPWPAPQSAKYSDMVSKTDDWYYMMRLSFYF